MKKLKKKAMKTPVSIRKLAFTVAKVRRMKAKKANIICKKGNISIGVNATQIKDKPENIPIIFSI
jgi:hypothetical protein